MFENADSLILGAVDSVFSRAVKSGVRLVVLLGDVSDTHVLEDSARASLISLLAKYDRRLDIRIILGNHDVAETAVHSLHTLEVVSKSWFRTVKVFTGHEVEDYNGVPLEFLAWPAERPKLKNSVCFAHYEVSGATRDNGRKVKEGHTETFEASNHFVQGHLHTPHSVRNHWFVGTLAQMSFGERLPKGFGEFQARMEDKRLVFRKRHIKLQPPWCLHNVVLDSKADVKGYTKLLETFGPNARVKLFVSDGVSLPDDWLMTHPEIVNRLDYSGERELQTLQEEELTMETQQVSISHTEMLPRQLKKMGATKSSIDRCLEIVSTLER